MPAIHLFNHPASCPLKRVHGIAFNVYRDGWWRVCGRCGRRREGEGGCACGCGRRERESGVGGKGKGVRMDMGVGGRGEIKGLKKWEG